MACERFRCRIFGFWLLVEVGEVPLSLAVEEDPVVGWEVLGDVAMGGICDWCGWVGCPRRLRRGNVSCFAWRCEQRSHHEEVVCGTSSPSITQEEGWRMDFPAVKEAGELWYNNLKSPYGGTTKRVTKALVYGC